jgi:hypothetical protein
MGLLSFLFGCGDQDSPEVEVTITQYQQVDIYRDLRNQILNLTVDDFQLSHESDQPIAILMETGYPEAVATLVATADGSASLYFSSGGGTIGGGEHESVRAAAVSFLQTASHFESDMQKTESFPLPRQAAVRFYLVTTNGVLTAEAIEDDLGNMRHKLSPLFHKGHDLITAIRVVSSR